MEMENPADPLISELDRISTLHEWELELQAFLNLLELDLVGLVELSVGSGTG